MKRYALTNQSADVQVVKTSKHHVERTLFPGQSVTVDADPTEFLEIYTYQWMTSILTDRVFCQDILTEDLHGLELVSA